MFELSEMRSLKMASNTWLLAIWLDVVSYESDSMCRSRVILRDEVHPESNIASEVVDIMRTRPRRYAHGPRRACCPATAEPSGDVDRSRGDISLDILGKDID